MLESEHEINIPKWERSRINNTRHTNHSPRPRQTHHSRSALAGRGWGGSSLLPGPSTSSGEGWFTCYGERVRWVMVWNPFPWTSQTRVKTLPSLVLHTWSVLSGNFTGIHQDLPNAYYLHLIMPSQEQSDLSTWRINSQKWPGQTPFLLRYFWRKSPVNVLSSIR